MLTLPPPPPMPPPPKNALLCQLNTDNILRLKIDSLENIIGVSGVEVPPSTTGEAAKASASSTAALETLFT